MKALVTGSAGFIGFHLSRRLLEDGHEVVGFDGFTPYYDVSLKEARHEILCSYPAYTPVRGMLEDGDRLLQAARTAQPDVILHLAAQAGVRYSLENPKAYVDSNLVGSWRVLEAARHVRPQHLLMASTSSVYGASPTVPFHESDKIDEPLTLYAASKKAMEVMAHSYAHLYAVPTTAFRFFTVYGPYGRPDMALYKFVDAALSGRPIEVYGHGKMARDCTSVHDLVEAIVRLMAVPPAEHNRVSGEGLNDTLSAEAPFRIVNIGGGQPVPLSRFVDVIEAAVGRPIERRMLPMQPGDVPRTYASPALLKALTGYVPCTTVEETVAEFVAWYRQTVQPQDMALQHTA